jgi:hypothetical protein
MSVAQKERSKTELLTSGHAWMDAKTKGVSWQGGVNGQALGR